MKLAITIAVAAALLGCSASSKEGALEPVGPKIAGVDIAGNDAVGDDALIGGLATRGPEGIIFKEYARYDSVEVERDVQRIESFYKRQGYFSARVTGVDVEPRGDRVEVRFEVSEGAPTHITGVAIRGLPESLRSEPMVEELRGVLERGSVFDNELYEKVKDDLRGFLILHGYARAEVEGVVEVDRDRREAAIELDARPGPLIRLGQTEIIGLDEVPEEAVRARLAWEPGDVYNPARFDETRSQLYELGFFRGVRIELDEPTPGAEAAGAREETTGVNLLLTEVPDHEVRLGGGFAADSAHYQIRARASYTQFHFLHPLAALRFDLEPAYGALRNDTNGRGWSGEGTASLQRHDLFARRVHGEVALRYERIELEPYTSRGPGVRLAIGRPLYDGALRIAGGWELRRLTFPEIHPAIDMATAADVGLVSPYRVAFFDQLVALDRRDNILDPHEGYFLELRAEEGGTWAGGEFDYLKITADARGYLEVSSRVVLAARILFGGTLAGDLPITRRFFGGGAADHRGFGSRQLSPTVSRENPGSGEIERTQIGGEALVESSGEIRLDVARLRNEWLGVVGFVDAGDVTESLGDLGTPHVAAGVGLRYDTVVGPVRLDVAFRLNRTGAGEPEPGDRWAYHISLGEAF